MPQLLLEELCPLAARRVSSHSFLGIAVNSISMNYSILNQKAIITGDMVDL